MAISSLEQHIAEAVSRLSPADQQKALEYARLHDHILLTRDAHFDQFEHACVDRW